MRLLVLFFIPLLFTESNAATHANPSPTALHKSFSTCHIAFNESGNEYIYKQCKDLVFEEYDRQIKLNREIKHHQNPKKWNNFLNSTLSNKETCYKAAQQTKKNHTLLKDLTMCDFIFNVALLSKASD